MAAISGSIGDAQTLDDTAITPTNGHTVVENRVIHRRNIMFADAGHQMWLQHPVKCRDDVEAFFHAHMNRNP
jgi:hypothetical protein